MVRDSLLRVQTAGALLISGVIIWIYALIISEALYPGYSVRTNYISDLGVGPFDVQIIFNISTIIFGILVFFAALILIKIHPERPYLYLMAIAGLGALFVGVFPEDMGILHYISAGTAFLSGSLAAAESGRWLKKPFCFLSAILGATGLISLIVMVTKTYSLLGPGGFERLIAYPLALWLISYGGFLISGNDNN